MKVYVGTSGWYYDWNKDSTLHWYVEKSGLNAIELNTSFYKFPFPNQIKAWSINGSKLSWVIKVHRSITHMHKLNVKCYPIFKKFTKTFEPLEDRIAFYLLQLPPNFSTNSITTLKRFIRQFRDYRFAIEFRHKTWYGFDFDSLDFKGVIVSPDSPEINRRIFDKNGTIYIRFHGRGSIWYSYKYSDKELDEIISLVKMHKPKEVLAFFNNDHNMLKNARYFISAI